MYLFKTLQKTILMVLGILSLTSVAQSSSTNTDNVAVQASESIPTGTNVFVGYGSSVVAAPIEEVIKDGDEYRYVVKGYRLRRSEIALANELVDLQQFDNLQVGQEVISKYGYGFSRDKLNRIQRIGAEVFYLLQAEGYRRRDEFKAVSEFKSIDTDGTFSKGQEVILHFGYNIYKASMSDIVQFGNETYYRFQGRGYLSGSNFVPLAEFKDLTTDGTRSVGQSVAIKFGHGKYSRTLLRIVEFKKRPYYLVDGFGFLPESNLDVIQ